MDTFKMRAVLAAAELGSLSRAAEKFSYTPSAFSHILTSFEDELGVRIFNRSSRGVTLTEEGKRICPELSAIAEIESRILRLVQETVNEKKYTLRIGTYSSISRSFLSGLLKQFCEEHPNIALYLTVADDLSGFLENDRADVVFADGRIIESGEWVPLMEDRCVAIAPPSLLEGRKEIDREELYGYPYISMDEEYLHGYFDEARFEKPFHFRSDDDLSVIHMVKQGFGIAVLPALVMRGNTEGVSVLELSPPLNRTVGFAYKKRVGAIFPALSQFIRFMKERAPLLGAETAESTDCVHKKEKTT